MRKPGLVSITFRNKTPLEILSLMSRAKLEAVEWGGDVHVPVKGGKAKEVLKMTRDYGIAVSSYGSYYRLGQGTDAFRYALEEAERLETDIIRVWAGTKGSRETAHDERKRLTEELLAIDEIASRSGIHPALEYHPNTLTDERESVKEIMNVLSDAGSGAKLYWQPRWDRSMQDRLESVSELGGFLSHMHVFSWKHTESGIEKLELSRGGEMWKKILERYTEGYALIEFVRDDSDEMLLSDAETLRAWLKG